MKILSLFLTFSLFIKSSYQFQGDATTYGGQILGGSCGFKKIWTNENKNFKYGVAINAKQYDNSLSCGKCVNIKYNNRNINAIVVDICPECAYGDLDLFTETYNELIQEDPGRKKISWEFINCPTELVFNSVQLRLDELNHYWVNIQPENFKCGIKSIFIKQENNWIEMARNDNLMMGLYFNYNTKINFPIQFKVINEFNEEIISDNYNELINLFNLNKQFTCNNKPVEVQIDNNLDIISVDKLSTSTPPSTNPTVTSVINHNSGSLRGSRNNDVIYEYIDCD